MEEKEVGHYVLLLEKMADLEAAIAGFYRACSSHDSEKDFWNNIWADEMAHASNLRKMAGIVLERRGVGFSAGRPFTLEGIVQFIAFVEQRTDAVNEGIRNTKSLFIVANEIEKQLWEDNYHEVLKTVDERYTSLMDRIIRDTEMHVDVTDKKAHSA